MSGEESTIGAHAALMEVVGHAQEERYQRVMRDRAIRRARRLGVPVSRIAAAAGVSRMGVYRVANTETRNPQPLAQ